MQKTMLQVMDIPSKQEIDKTNDIISNLNKKLMADFVQFLSAKNFFVNPDNTQYSPRSYHSNKLVELFVSNHATSNENSKSKKWSDFEDFALRSNWNNFISDHPPQFRRLFQLLLKKPSSYNIFTDSLNFGPDSKSLNSIPANCGIIKLRNLLNDFIRITRLHARLGKGINRCLNSCYSRACLIITGGHNPLVTGPFSECESQMCFHLYNTLQENHTLDTVCEQIGNSLNRPKELVRLFIQTLEQIKCDSSPLKTNPVGRVHNIVHSNPLMETKEKNKPKNEVKPLQLGTIERATLNDKTIEPKFELVACENLESFSVDELRNKFISGIEEDKWPNEVEDVLLYAIKWDYKHRLGLDLDGLGSRVEPQCLTSMIAHLNLNWGLVLKLLINNRITNLNFQRFLPCIHHFKIYWKHKLKHKLLNTLLHTKSQDGTLASLTYDKTHFDIFMTTLIDYVLERKNISLAESYQSHKFKQLTPKENIRLLKILKNYYITFPDRGKKPSSKWCKVCPSLNWKYLCNRYNSDRSNPLLSQNRLKKSYKRLKREYVPDCHGKNESEILDLLYQKCMPIFEDMVNKVNQEDEARHLQTNSQQTFSGKELEKCDENKKEVEALTDPKGEETSMLTNLYSTILENAEDNNDADDVVVIEPPQQQEFITSSTLQNIKNEIKKSLVLNLHINQEQSLSSSNKKKVTKEKSRKLYRKRTFKNGKIKYSFKKVVTKHTESPPEDDQLGQSSKMNHSDPTNRSEELRTLETEQTGSMVKIIQEKKKNNLLGGTDIETAVVKSLSKNNLVKVKKCLKLSENKVRIRKIRERLLRLRNALKVRKLKCIQLKNKLNLENVKLKKQLSNQSSSKNDKKFKKMPKAGKPDKESIKKNKKGQNVSERPGGMGGCSSVKDKVEETLKSKKKKVTLEAPKNGTNSKDNTALNKNLKKHTELADETTAEVVECNDDQILPLAKKLKAKKIVIITIQDSD